MKRYFNKHWLKEKEYYRIIKQYNFIISTRSGYMTFISYFRDTNKDLTKIQNILKSEFYNFHYIYSGPKWEKRYLNKSLRRKSKQITKKELENENIDILYCIKKRLWY